MTNLLPLVKKPNAIYEPAQDLQPGDILIFSMNPKSKRFANTAVRMGQQTLNEEGGRSNTEHAAFVAKIDGELKIVHLLGKGFQVANLDHIDKRTTHVYRIKDAADRKKMGDMLSDIIIEKQHEMKKRLTWRMMITVFAYVRRFINSIGIRNSSLAAGKVSTEEQKLHGSSICSKFVADCFIEACRRSSAEDKNFKDNYMNIYSATAVKTLQAYVARNINYDYYIVPHARRDVYEELKKCILKEVKRLSHCTSYTAYMKALRLNNIVKKHDQNGIDDPYQKALALLGESESILRVHRGIAVGRTKSYINVIEYAKSQGLYASYIREGVQNDDESTRAGMKAKLAYGNSESCIYDKFRQRGYSDAEARFETRPTLVDWLALNPRRVAAVSVTGVGLFAVLAYGGVRVALAKNRNQDFKM